MKKIESKKFHTSKKHNPKGLSIIYEDEFIIVVNKTEGLLTIGSKIERVKTAQARLNTYVKKGNKQSSKRVFIVHRLDKATSGILVFAKNEKAKSFLQDNWKNFKKKYVTVAYGKLASKEGIITSYLSENKMLRMYSSNNENGKYSKTGYKVLKETKYYSLLEIDLYTGRKNQIRVHLSENGNSIVGDRVYGDDKISKRLMLHSYSLTIKHPFSLKEMSFTTEIPTVFKNLVKIN